MKKQTSISEGALKTLIILLILSIGLSISFFSFWRRDKRELDSAEALCEQNMLDLAELVYTDLSTIDDILGDIDDSQPLGYTVNSAARMLAVTASDMYSHYRAVIAATYLLEYGTDIPEEAKNSGWKASTELYELSQYMMLAVADGEEGRFKSYLDRARGMTEPLLEVYGDIYAGTDYSKTRTNIITDSILIFNTILELGG